MHRNIIAKRVRAAGLKFICRDNSQGQRAGTGKVIGRAYLYILRNDLHQQPFGFLEDVYVDPDFRGQGLATQLVNCVINAARKAGCYKLVAASRHERAKVHDLYLRLGFKDHGLEFRLDLAAG